ncbi:hypothetical protein AB1Y20_019878 [Prymnesium parvum]|uniref:Cyclic nucleotide-binding domain-containing protein n=1 Tax=Prymnesium parvum TaxID=97485 RepID=A0AB34JVY1_PRYPA
MSRAGAPDAPPWSHARRRPLPRPSKVTSATGALSQVVSSMEAPGADLSAPISRREFAPLAHLVLQQHSVIMNLGAKQELLPGRAPSAASGSSPEMRQLQATQEMMQRQIEQLLELLAAKAENAPSRQRSKRLTFAESEPVRREVITSASLANAEATLQMAEESLRTAEERAPTMRSDSCASQITDISSELQSVIDQILSKKSFEKEVGARMTRTLTRAKAYADAVRWMDRHIPVFHPDAKITRIYSFLSTMLSIYILFVIPVEVAFNDSVDPEGSAISVVNIVADVLCVGRTLMRAHTGIYDRGVYLGSTHVILRRYLKNRVLLVLDLISCFPYSCISLALPPGSLERRLFLMLKVMYPLVPACGAVLDTFSTSYRSSFDPALVRVALMVLMLLASSHWFGCLWWLVGVEQADQDRDPSVTPWGPSPWVREQGFGVRYFQAFLWGVGMMTTQMPYDVLPSTALEVFVTVFSILVALLIANLTASSITSMLSSIDSRDAAYRAQMATLAEYMRAKGVDQKTAHRVIEFYRYGRCASFKEILASTTLPQLPMELTAELHAQLHRSLIRKCPIFDTRKFPIRVVINLLHKLQPMIGVPRQLIIQEGHSNSDFFIIERGTVRVWKNFFHPQTRTLLRTLYDNDFFGERSILAAWEKGGNADTATATCECLGFCDMLVLDFASFKQTLEDDGIDLKTGSETIKKMTFQRDERVKLSREPAEQSDQDNLHC